MRKILLLFLFVAFSVFGQTNEKTCELLKKISFLMKREHFKPRPIDDSLSVFVFDEFVDALDENRNLFTKEEYENLCKHRLTLDDDILKKDCAFIDDFANLYQMALERKRKIIEKIQLEKLDYSGTDSIRFSRENFPFDLEASDFECVWKKRIRFEILEDISKTSDNADSLKQHFTELEKISSEKIFRNNLCKIDNILNSTNGFKMDLQNNFLNVFCTYFDPHSSYFFYDAKMSFMSSLSTNSLSLGLELGMNENEEIVVEEIVPGGPAAESKKIEKDDVIVKVSDKNGTEYLVSCTPLETIGDIIFSDANKEINFTIRKKNGVQLDVRLVKKVMQASENSVTSFIAEKKNRVGYIRIPSFYSDFEGHSSHGVADDVAKEVAKLRKDNVEGIVLDLQDNGGGSMDEAIRMAGMFVDNGPVSVSLDKYGNKNVMRDINRGMIYNGPLVVVINGNSASASEFFTAALQDYNRALVIGATSLGKATIQVVEPLDENQEEFVKVTIQKFYRVTGESSQIKGIVPDVFMPVVYDSIMQREKSFKNALPHDFIQTDARFRKAENDFTDVIAKSRERLKSNVRFNEIIRLNDTINKVYNGNTPPLALDFADVFKKIKSISNLWKKIKQESMKPTGCKISNTSFDAKRIRSDQLLKEINDDRIRQVKSNPYLEEAVNIIRDFNQMKN